jgi:hypothetical protein
MQELNNTLFFFTIKVINHDIKVFKSALRDSLLNSFCTVEKCCSNEGSSALCILLNTFWHKQVFEFFFSIMVTYSTPLDIMQHQWVIWSQHLKILVVCDLLILENEGNVLPGNVQIKFSIYTVSHFRKMEYSLCHMFTFMIFVQDVYIQLCQLHISYLNCKSTVILSSYLYPNVWSSIIPSGRLTETLYAHLMFVRHAAFLIHFFILF